MGSPVIFCTLLDAIVSPSVSNSWLQSGIATSMASSCVRVVSTRKHEAEEEGTYCIWDPKRKVVSRLLSSLAWSCEACWMAGQQRAWPPLRVRSLWALSSRPALRWAVVPLMQVH